MTPLKKEERKSEYLQQLDASQSERLMQGDQVFETARDFIYKGQFSQGRNALVKAAKLNPSSPEIRIYLVWADLKLNQKVSDAFITDIDKRLNQIPIESRDNAAYYHCRGLFYKVLGDLEKSKKILQNSDQYR
jgi:hypothetical protein